MSDAVKCTDKDCDKDARCAVKTIRPTRGNMSTTIYYDERTAPKSALPYCKEHGVHLVHELAKVLVDEG